MDVAAAHGDVVKRADVFMNRDGDAADNEAGDEEAERAQEETLAFDIGEAFFIDGAQAAARKDQEQRRENRRDDQRCFPKASMSPGHSYDSVFREA